jgi:putative transcriptional regulator
VTALLLTCRDVTGLLTEYQEGALRLDLRVRLRAHLALCPPCRAFLASLQALPRTLARLVAEDPLPPVGLEGLLQGALGRIRTSEGLAPTAHPPEEIWARAGQDPTLALLLGAHLGRCATCRDARPRFTPFEGTPGDPLGPALRARLEPEARWTWHRLGLRGSRVAEVLRQGGQALYLLTLPEGVQFPEHDHGGPEVALVLEGRFSDGPEVLASGDVRVHAPGQAHAPVGAGPGDCLLLAHMEGGPRFRGWRRLLG